MPHNTTEWTTVTSETSDDLVLSWELSDAIIFILGDVILPCIAVLGIAGNVAGIIALTREGFRKCSSLLLLSLSVSNLLFLIGIINILQLIYFSYPVGFYFSEDINYMCYMLFQIGYFSSSLGALTCPLIPLLITGERLLVIFYPFRAFVILTPRLTVSLLLSVYLLTAISIVGHDILGIQLKTYVIKGVNTALMVYSDLWGNRFYSDLFHALEIIVNYMTGIIPLSLITVGCVVIELKILHITKRRRQLTSGLINANTKHRITKTTKTLLQICLLYILCYGCGFIVVYLSEGEYLKNQEPLRLVVWRVEDLIVCLNCLGDFLIYFAANNSFWNSVTASQRTKTKS